MSILAFLVPVTVLCSILLHCLSLFVIAQVANKLITVNNLLRVDASMATAAAVVDVSARSNSTWLTDNGDCERTYRIIAHREHPSLQSRHEKS